MEASVSSSTILTAPTSTTVFRTNFTHYSKSTLNLSTPRVNHDRWMRTNKSSKVRKVAAITEFTAAADPAPSGLTWQIVIGAIAGVTPFVVAGIEFSRRIIAQKRCEVCGGSGLVLKKEYYVRCPGCGGFLPWQSWKRFFSG
ncbi:hypothetical protein TorRG33x02_101430 [Trema orientale]|uniref:Transmembrane protein n=1 Tax=Trema orientale TaxID=63057 RepID=A0A2P5F8L7_TREOI|nr:hypothetical protein TorRG33x02_101430 [Trema orientale]